MRTARRNSGFMDQSSHNGKITEFRKEIQFESTNKQSVRAVRLRSDAFRYALGSGNYRPRNVSPCFPIRCLFCVHFPGQFVISQRSSPVRGKFIIVNMTLDDQ